MVKCACGKVAVYFISPVTHKLSKARGHCRDCYEQEYVRARRYEAGVLRDAYDATSSQIKSSTNYRDHRHDPRYRLNKQ